MYHGNIHVLRRKIYTGKFRERKLPIITNQWVYFRVYIYIQINNVHVLCTYVYFEGKRV